MYPCILFALRREAQPFYRYFRQRRLLTPAPCPAWLCGTSLKRVLVLESGIGPECCVRALRWLMESYLPGQGLLQPLFLIAAGFAGALHEECRAGDVVVATEVLDTHGQRWPCYPGSDRPRDGEQGWRHGWVLSTACLVGEPQEKEQLGRRHGALAVDMESAAAARFCAERGIPFACVRVISDELQTRLSPQLLALLTGAEVSLPRVLVSVARSPGMLLELWRLARDTRRGARQLARALLHWLDDGDGARRPDSRTPQGILLS